MGISSKNQNYIAAVVLVIFLLALSYPVIKSNFKKPTPPVEQTTTAITDNESMTQADANDFMRRLDLIVTNDLRVAISRDDLAAIRSANLKLIALGDESKKFGESFSTRKFRYCAAAADYAQSMGNQMMSSTAGTQTMTLAYADARQGCLHPE